MCSSKVPSKEHQENYFQHIKHVNVTIIIEISKVFAFSVIFASCIKFYKQLYLFIKTVDQGNLSTASASDLDNL